MTGEELFLLASFSGERSFDAIDEELDRRSTAAQVRRLSVVRPSIPMAAKRTSTVESVAA
jgi:hypothetical protein